MRDGRKTLTPLPGKRLAFLSIRDVLWEQSAPPRSHASHCRHKALSV